jgi:hypothetical protein
MRRDRLLQDVQVMDEASRGPLGAIMVLSKCVGGPFATLGAIITICTVAFSPFLQQLVEYPTNIAEQPSLEATTPRVVNYTLLWDFGRDNDREARDAMETWSMAYLEFGSEAFTPRGVVCPRPAVQCAWQYRSVGWCSECRKATGRLSDCIVKDHRNDEEKFCQLIVDNAESEAVHPKGLMRHWNTSDSDNSSRISLQYHTQVEWAANVSAFVTNDNTIIGQPVVTLTHATIIPVEDVFLDIYHSDQGALQIEHIDECVLTLCEREYNTTTADGGTSWDLISTDYGKRFQSGSCWRPEHSAQDVVLTSPDGGLTRLNETERAFCPIGTYTRFLRTIFGNTTDSLSYNLTHSWQKLDRVPKPAIDFPKSLASIAAGLTNYGLNISNHYTIGKASSAQVTIHVRWQWIALPALLELGGVVLLLSTIFYSRHVRVPIWKSSLLAIYYHQVEDLRESRAIFLLSEMDKASNNASVQISRTGDDRGFMLRRVRDGVRH